MSKTAVAAEPPEDRSEVFARFTRLPVAEAGVTITGQALALAAPAWPYPGVATVHALVAALGLDGEPIAQQASAVRQFMQDPAWDAAPPVLQRDVRRWLGLLYFAQAEFSITGQAIGLAPEDGETITAQMASPETISGQAADAYKNDAI